MKQAPKVPDFAPLFIYKLVKDSIPYLEHFQKKYGDVYWKKLIGYKHYFLCHPSHAEHLLSKNQDNYRKYPPFVSNFEPVLGTNNLLSTSDPVQWKRDRDIAKTGFEPEIHFEKYANTIARNCQELLTKLQIQYGSTGQPCPIGQEFDKLALKNIHTTLFNDIDIDIEYFAKQVPKVFELITQKATSITKLPWILPFLRKRTFDKLVREIQKIKSELVLSRIRKGKDYDDLLGSFLSAYQVKDSRCPHLASLENHAITFDIVGYTTITSALRSILTEVIRNREVEAKIFAEVQQVCGTRLPTYADFDKLSFTQAVIKEALRLHPPLAFITRQLIEDDQVGSFALEKDSCTMLNAHLIHHHKDFWTDPQSFNPERFIAKPYGQDYLYAYIPFGGGKRACLGKNFAFMELCLILAMLVQRFEFSFPKDHKVKRNYIAMVFTRLNLESVFIKERI